MVITRIAPQAPTPTLSLQVVLQYLFHIQALQQFVKAQPCHLLYPQDMTTLPGIRETQHQQLQ